MKRKAESQPIERVNRPPPIGSANCFAGKSFVFTGELSSLNRTEAQDIVKRYGGFDLSIFKADLFLLEKHLHQLAKILLMSLSELIPVLPSSKNRKI
jgi:hypothetical protein